MGGGCEELFCLAGWLRGHSWRPAAQAGTGANPPPTILPAPQAPRAPRGTHLISCVFSQAGSHLRASGVEQAMERPWGTVLMASGWGKCVSKMERSRKYSRVRGGWMGNRSNRVSHMSSLTT